MSLFHSSSEHTLSYQGIARISAIPAAGFSACTHFLRSPTCSAITLSAARDFCSTEKDPEEFDMSTVILVPKWSVPSLPRIRPFQGRDSICLLEQKRNSNLLSVHGRW